MRSRACRARLSGAPAQTLAQLAVGAPVFENQKVGTGEAARLELTFDDGTKLTLGEHADMTLDTFVYDPAHGTGKMALAVKGAFRFVSGQISKQPNKEVAVATPVATVGIRGTEFWGGPIDDQTLGVFLIDGEVSVTNAAGEQVLDTPGQGTNIANPGDAPGPVTHLAAGQGAARTRDGDVPVEAEVPYSAACRAIGLFGCVVQLA